MSESKFTAEKLTPYTTKVVEADRFGQFPFMYIIQGVDKVILIDTGCGENNYFEFVHQNYNPKQLPYLIVNTHVHFDHVGSNYQFENNKNCTLLGIYMSEGNQTFTKNLEINSLSLAHGAKTKPFTVTHWLRPHVTIPLDSAKPTDSLNCLHAIPTPGHTPDSLSIWAPFDQSLFVGDLLYPWTCVHIDCIGSSLKQFVASINLLVAIVCPGQEASPLSASSSSSIAPLEPSKVNEEHNQLVSFLQETIDPGKTLNLNLELILSEHGWNLENACNAFFNDMDRIIKTYSQQKNTNSASKTDPQVSYSPEIPPELTQIAHSDRISKARLRCGHVEGDMEPQGLLKMKELVQDLLRGSKKASRVEEGYGEFSSDLFTVMLSMKELDSLRKTGF